VIAASVSLLHDAAAHRPVSQLLTGVTMEVFPPVMKSETRGEGLRHVTTSGLAAMLARVLMQPDERVCLSWWMSIHTERMNGTGNHAEVRTRNAKDAITD
jgi:hypothetical protein